MDFVSWYDMTFPTESHKFHGSKAPTRYLSNILIGKSFINGPFSIAMLVYWRVYYMELHGSKAYLHVEWIHVGHCT
jgi:hypothetical protein